jgi:NAD(P)-dependent dehydrogenase (short-subunit alcohol dehydrogenase family)
MKNLPRTVIVTGAGGTGCGRAVAVRFAAGGDAVIVSDLNVAGGHETVRQIESAGGRAAFCEADVRDERQMHDLIAFAETTFGALNVLVNNASSPHSFGAGPEQWLNCLQTDLMGTIHATRWAIESMRRGGGGAIVNVASISALWHGRKTPGGLHGYDVAKAGVIRLTTGLAGLAATDHIHVNCLAPGWIATDGPREYWASLTPAERAERGVPSRLLSVEEVSQAVVELAGDASLAGRVLLWWSEERPRLIQWGDRGYRDFVTL